MLECLAVTVQSIDSCECGVSSPNALVWFGSCLLFQKDQLLLLVPSQDWCVVFLLNTFEWLSNYCVINWTIMLIHKPLNLLCSRIFLAWTSLVLTWSLLLLLSWFLIRGVVNLSELLTTALMTRLFFPALNLFANFFSLGGISIQLRYGCYWLLLYEFLLLLGFLIREICDFRLSLSANFKLVNFWCSFSLPTFGILSVLLWTCWF